MIGWEALANSSAPLADVAAVALGNNGFIILGIIALFSTTNTILISLVATSRMLYGIAERKDLPKVFAHVSKHTKTPVVAVFSVMILSMILVFLGDIELVANLTNTAVFVTFILINLSLIALRYKMPDAKRKFKVPLNVGKFPILPVFGVISCLFMLSNINFKIVFALIVLVAVGFIAHDLVMKKHK
jgi:APA family basic amino acid/polyamine antiporter